MSTQRISAVLFSSALLLMVSSSSLGSETGLKGIPDIPPKPSLPADKKPLPPPLTPLTIPKSADQGSGKYTPPLREPGGMLPTTPAPEPAAPDPGPDIIASTVELLAPAVGERLQPNTQQDQTVVFRWRQREAYKPIDENILPQSTYDKRLGRVKLAQTRYSVCVHSGSACDATSEGRMRTEVVVDNFTDPSWTVAANGGLQRTIQQEATLPFDNWQGTTLHWSVETCTSYVDQAYAVDTPGRIIGPNCSLSASRPMHWLLPRVSFASARTDPRYSHTWHLLFDWDAVTGADYYEVCLHRTADGLDSNCIAAEGMSVYPAHEEQQNNTGYARFGEPYPGLGEKGDTFWWKVAACASPTLLQVEPGAQCTYSVGFQTHWPD